MKKVIKTLVAAVAFATTCSVHAFQPTDIVVFGDSLSDVGYGSENFILPTFANGPTKKLQTILPELADKEVKFTSPAFDSGSYAETGMVWGQYVSDMTGIGGVGTTNNLDTKKGTQNGTNYAAGGAVTSGKGIGFEGIYSPPSSEEQIANFLTQHGGKADASAAYVVWVGANNLLKLVMDSDGDGFMDGTGEPIKSDSQLYEIGKQEAASAALDISNQVERLEEAGAEKIIVVNMPRLDLTPMADDLVAAYGSQPAFKNLKVTMKNATQAFNDYIPQLLERDEHVTIVDLEHEMLSIVNNKYFEVGDVRIDFPHVTGTACKKLDFGDPLSNGLYNSSMACHPLLDLDENGNAIARDVREVEGYMFEDSVHPTSRLHEAIARKMIDVIENEV